MLTFFPQIKPYNRYEIEVTPPHRLYVEESGNPGGLPVVVMHDGPGWCSFDTHRRFFDPELYRIILFDQRGCGRSKPRAEIEGNCTQALIDDMEVIREKLSIQRWMIFGAAWGAALGLAYAEQFADRVMGLILWGTCLSRFKDIQWLCQNGANAVFPDEWEEFVRLIPANERDDLLTAYHKRLMGSDDVARMSAAKAWCSWLGHCASLHPNHGVLQRYQDAQNALNLARISCHYLYNNNFFEQDQLLTDAYKLTNVPGYIVHGRYDMIAPLENAWTLHKVWPRAELAIIRDAGHCETEPGPVDVIVRAAKTMEHYHS